MPKIIQVSNSTPASKAVVVKVQQPGQGKKKKKKRSRTGNASQSGISPNLTVEYFQSLVDPFNFPGPKLGWGCLVPSTLISGFFRGTATSNADGSIAIVVLPCVKAAISIYGGGVGAVSASSVIDLANQAAITTNTGEGRVVSMGIRAWPDIAMTSAPGAAYAGAMVPTNYTDLNAMSPTDMINLPSTHICIGMKGASATGRPIDPSSFVFDIAPVDGLGYTNAAWTGTDIPFSCPYIIFTGIGDAVPVFYEVVINIEATYKIGHSNTTILPGSSGPENVLSDHWPSFESMYNHVRHVLPSPGRPGEASAASDSSLLGSILSTGLRVAGKVFARGLGLDNGRRFGGGGMYFPQMAFGGSGQQLPRQFAGYLN